MSILTRPTTVRKEYARIMLSVASTRRLGELILRALDRWRDRDPVLLQEVICHPLAVLLPALERLGDVLRLGRLERLAKWRLVRVDHGFPP